MQSLRFAVRARAVLRVFGRLCGVIALLSLVPALVGILVGETEALAWLLLAAALLGAPALLLRGMPQADDLQTNEALVVAASVFLAASLAGAVALYGTGLDWVDALFEATSGVTTTGLSTLSSVEGRSHTFLFDRAFMQWYGGLGIVVLSVAIVLGPGVAARRLEAATFEFEDLAGSARTHARKALGVYAVMSVAGFGLVWACGVQPFRALLYTLAAVSTGGYAPDDASLAALPGWLPAAATIAVCMAGSMTFSLYSRALRSGPAVLLSDIELRGVIGFGLLSSASLALIWALAPAARGHPDWIHAPLLAFSAQATAGFSSTDVSALDPASKLVLIASMAVGGSTGSSAGGIKVLRVLVIAQVLRWTLARVHLSRRAVSSPRLRGEILQPEEVQRALSLVIAFFGATGLSWFAFLACGYPAFDSLFEVVSALGTVGLSTGVTAPDLPAGLKLVLCADMLLGRLEIVAFLILFSPRTWFGRRRS